MTNSALLRHLLLTHATSIAWKIGTICPLGDDALEPVTTRRLAENLAVAAFVFALDEARRRLFQDRGQSLLALEEWQVRNVLAIELQQIEREKTSPPPPLSDAC
jgi:hypothetical protein